MTREDRKTTPKDWSFLTKDTLEHPENDNAEDDDELDEKGTYAGTIINGPSLRNSLMYKGKQEISITVRPLPETRVLVGAGKASLLTNSGKTYQVTVIGTGSIHPAPGAIASGAWQPLDQVVLIDATTISLENAQQAQKFIQEPEE